MLLALVASEAPLRTQAAGNELLGVVILSRHGVRAPTQDPRYLAPSRLWPPWPVLSYGDLTTHGEDLARRFGAFYRRDVISAGLFPPPNCGTWRDRVYVYADVEQRTRRTAEALLAGIGPMCGYSVHAATGTHDPIFHPDNDVTGSANVPNLRARNPKAFDDLHRILGCCALDGPSALRAASTAAELFQLEYAQGMVVAWGRVNPDPRPFLSEIAPFHVLDFTLRYRSPDAARAGASNLLAHISETLKQLAGRGSGQFTHAYRPPASAKMVILVGHDTNEANIGGLLGLNWSLAGFETNDMPPASSLAFELRRCGSLLRDVCVRLRFRSLTLDTMRSAGYALPQAGRHSEFVETNVAIPECPGACTLAQFDKLVATKIDSKRVAL